MLEPSFPYDWYWVDETDRTYSSNRQQVADTHDAAFVSWLSKGNVPTPWPRDENGAQSDEALQTVLSQYGLYISKPSLEALKVSLKAEIDASAEQERLKYITPGSGQAMTYQEKFSELTTYEADSNPVEADYPMLSAEIGITASSLSGVAAAVRTAYNLWKDVGGAIESSRLKAKAGVERATTENAARAAANVSWPIP